MNLRRKAGNWCFNMVLPKPESGVWNNIGELIEAYKKFGWSRVIEDLPYVEWDDRRKSWVITHYRLDCNSVVCSRCGQSNMTFVQFLPAAHFTVCCARCRIVIGSLPTSELENLGSHRATLNEILEVLKETKQYRPIGLDTFFDEDDFMRVIDGEK